MSGDEVPGKKGTPLTASQMLVSREIFDVFCHSCDEDNKRVEACGFCVDCGDYLCKDCVQYHRKFRGTRNHVIQNKDNKDNMPKDASRGNRVHQTKDVCNEPCTKHPGKVIEYYCEPHAELGCSVCVMLGHITCGVGYIPELSRGIATSDEYEDLIEAIVYLNKEFEQTKADSEESIAEVERRSEAYTAEFTHLGEDIIQHITYLMQRAIGEKDEVFEGSLVRLRDSQERSKKMIENTISMKTDLESRKITENQCFVLMKTLQLNKKELINTLRERKIDSKPTAFLFSESLDLKCAKETNTFGTLVKYKNVEEQCMCFDISTGSNNELPNITAIELLSDGKIAIVDDSNKSLKLVCTKDNIMKEIQLQHEPFDITEVSKGQLAVTLAEEDKIQFLTVTGWDVKLGHMIETVEYLMGVVACQNKLIATCVDKCLIMDMTGKVLRKIFTRENGEQLFRDTRYVAVNPSNNMICVSDGDHRTVTCMTLKGDVKYVYSDENMEDPNGLVFNEDGSVLSVEGKVSSI